MMMMMAMMQAVLLVKREKIYVINKNIFFNNQNVIYLCSCVHMIFVM